ncbi:hypothetical protein LXL04_015346 [Taraxacum kok-saghyz]
MRAADDKTARRVEMEDGFFIEVVFRDDWFDDVFLEICCDFIVGDSFIVLGGDENGVDTKWDHGSVIVMVLDCYLGFSVGSEPCTGAVLADFSQLGSEFGGEDMAEGHEFRGLVSGVPEHMTLVSGPDVFRLFVVGVQTDIVRNESNLAAGITDDFFVINVGFGGDFSEDHDHVGFGAGFASDLAVGVLC